MAKIVILTGSPHNPGTSKQLADAFEKGAKEAGNETFTVLMRVFKELVRPTSCS